MPQPRAWLASRSAFGYSPHPYPFLSALNDENQKTLERSISFYQGRIQTSPDDGLDRAALANLYIQLARITENEDWYLTAEQLAQESLANLPFNNNAALLALAKIASARHDFTEAIRLSEQATGEDAIAIAIAAKLAMGKVSEAAAEAQTLVDRHQSLGSLTLRGLVHSAQGDDDRAMEDFQQAIASEEVSEPRGSAQVRTFLGEIYLNQGEPILAKQLYREALQIVPDYPLTYIHLAELELVMGDFRAAEGYYERVGTSEALHGIARARALQGKAGDEAWDVAEAALRQKLDSNSTGYSRDLAHLLLERGDSADVAEAIALMETEVTRRRDVKTLDLLAWALTRANRWKDAQGVMQEALDHEIQDAAIAYRAGEIELALDNSDRAAQLFQLAQSIEPGFNHQSRQRLGLVAQNLD
ncbi:MAG: tetratricopeptide repeat protein [Elainellaceae cyanobacterium]